MNSQQARPSIREADFSSTGGGAEHGLELVVAFLEVGLVAVGGEQLGVCELVVVGDERELPVGGGVVGDLLVVDGEGEREDRLGRLAISGLLAGAAALLLAEALLLGLGDPASVPNRRRPARRGRPARRPDVS
jgi:hypothetical protein